MNICRVEEWLLDKETGETKFYEWENLYFVAKEDGETYWFDEELSLIPNPLKEKGFKLRQFNKIVNSGYNGTFEASDEFEYDIIFFEEGVFPRLSDVTYERGYSIDYVDEITKILSKIR